MLSSTLLSPPTEINIPIDDYVLSEHKWQKFLRGSTKRFNLACWHRRARKTTCALNKLIEACCENRDCTYGYVAPTFRQAKSIAVVDPMMMKHYLPKEVCKKPFNESDLRQEFITGCVLEMKGADDPDSIRGVGWKGVVLEEWAMMRYGRIIWEEILEPILRENGGWALFLFTPKGRNFAYEYFEKAKSDKTGDWGYSLLRASESGLINAVELEKAKQSMPERLFMQEFECEFLEDASSVFHGVDSCVYGSLENAMPGHKYIIGADLGRTNDYTVFIVLDVGLNRVVGFDRLSDTSWNIQKEKLILLAKRYNNAQIVIDATGFSAGSVVAEDLKNMPLVDDLKMVNLSVLPFKFTAQSKKALVEKLIVAIEQRLISFPHIEALVDELKAFTYEISALGNIRYTAPEGLHDDCVMALGMAVWGLGSYIYAPLSMPKRKASINIRKARPLDNI